MKTNVTNALRLLQTLLVFAAVSAVLMASPSAQAENVSLAWDANTEADLAGYRIHYGTTSRAYTSSVDVGRVTTTTISNLTAGRTYYFAATAYNASGTASGYSSEVSRSIPAPNGAPTTPATPSGAASALVNTAITFSTSATDPNGDSLQYRYDWGGGALSSWGASSQSRAWPAAGQYAVKAQARDSLGAESAWSAAKNVTISNPTPSPIPAPTPAPAPAQTPTPTPTPTPAPTAESAQSQPPAAPVIVAPLDDQEVDLTPVLQTAPFSSPAPGACHAQTRWQVFRDDDSLCVLDVQSDVALTSLSVAKLVLEEETAYFWRVQFIDAAGAASPWSDYEYFTTAALGIDLNSNGVPDAQEVGPRVDLDRNGVRDYKQSDLRAIGVVDGKTKIALSIAGSPTAIAIEALESADPNQTNPESSSAFAKLPFGLINFRIAVRNPGDEAAVKIYFSKAAPLGSKWYKYDATTGTWLDFSEYATFAPDRRSITLVLRDGGPGDADGIANGVIVDPSGVGVPKKEKRKGRNK